MGRVGRRLGALRKAAKNARDILARGRLGAPWRAPSEVVATGPNHRLRRYRTDPEGAYHGTVAPLVLVPPLMVTAEVYDISPELSPVRLLCEMGFDVWVVDFGIPEVTEGGMDRTLDDHVLAIDASIDAVRKATGQDVHLAGYSQGGLFCYQAAAYRRSAGIASIVAFGSPVQIHRNLPVPVADPIVERVLRLLRAGIEGPLDDLSGLPGTITSTGFKVFSARKELKQIAGFLRALPDREALEQREPTRRFLGGEGFVAWPGPAFKDFVDQVVVGNRMVTGGLVIAGRACALSDITIPVLVFVGLRDEMARPASVRGIRRAAPQASVHEVEIPSGHFGLVVGSRALSITWPTVAEWIAWHSGVGPAPGALTAPPADTQNEARSESHGLYELSVDLLDRAWDRAGDASVQAGSLFHALRWELPRMARLESIHERSKLGPSRLFREQAERLGDQTFLVWQERAYSWNDARRRIEADAQKLHQLGVGPGDHVDIALDAHPASVAALVALNRLGAVGVVAVSSDARLDAPAPERLVPLPPADEVEGRAGDLALLVRGHPLTNGRWATIALVAAAACQLTPRDTVFSTFAPTSTAALVGAWGGALVGGSRLALADGEHDLWAQIRRVGATVVFTDRDVAAELARGAPGPNPVRLVVGTGIDPDVHRALESRFDVQVRQVHAAAHGTVVFVDFDGSKPGTIGRRFPGSARVALVQERDGEIVRDAHGRCRLAAPGEVGRLLVSPRGTAALSVRRLEESLMPRLTGCFEDGDAWLDAGERLIRDADGDWWLS